MPIKNELKAAAPFRLAPFFSPRPWGQKDWSRWYANGRFAENVGESWLSGADCVVETGPWAGRRFAEVVSEHRMEILGEQGEEEFPLLLKLLMPKENLSLQVHPDDAFAQQSGNPRGKTECWYVLEAEPQAALALGVKAGMDAESIRSAIAAKTLEEKMEWLPVQAGEMIFVDAGTVHGIGPGVTLLETQQTCDITYRLYDYGRPRELHVEEALRVMRENTRAGKVQPVKVDGFVRLIQEKYFTVDRFELKTGESREMGRTSGPQILVGVQGGATLEGNGKRLPLERAKATIIPAGAEGMMVIGETDCTVIRAFPS